MLPNFLILLIAAVEPENPAFASFLVLLGANLGVSESCLTVSLLSLVGKEGQHGKAMTSLWIQGRFISRVSRSATIIRPVQSHGCFGRGRGHCVFLSSYSRLYQIGFEISSWRFTNQQ